MISYETTAPERRQVVADALEIVNTAEALAVNLPMWVARDDGGPDADARKAANRVMEALDKMSAQLYALRSKMVGEIREYDDANNRRVDALLADIRSTRAIVDGPGVGPGESQ